MSKPTLILLPGMDGTGRLFGPLVQALDADCDCRSLRYPASEPLGYAELTQLVRATLPVEEPFLIVAESFSGPIAIALAAAGDLPGLKGLVLAASFARNPRPGLRWIRPFAGLLPIRRLPRALISHLMFGPSAPPVLRASLFQALEQLPPAVMHARLRAVLAVDVTPDLKKIHLPILILHPTRDRIIPRAATNHLARHLPHALGIELDAPHLVLQSAPHDAASAIREFFSMHCNCGLKSAES